MTQGHLDPRIEAKMKKLLALADRGVGGEQATAQRMLQKLLNKHGLSIDDLLDEKKVDYTIKFTGAQEKILAFQTISKFLGSKIRGIVRPASVTFECTHLQGVEISTHWKIYRDAWRRERDALMTAFLNRNDIFAPSTDEAPQRPAPNPEQMAHHRRALELAMTMSVTHVHAQLPGGGV
jgi:hypothetical protein